MASYVSAANIINDDYCSLTNDAIDFTSVINSVRCDKAGAVSTFLGTTRDFFEGKEVTELYYEAYDEMAIEQMQSICTNLRQKWNLKRIAMQHRLGSCPIGEISVVIAISSEHRADSLEAVHAAINELKAAVPIWKKECYVGEQSTWKKNAEFSPQPIDVEEAAATSTATTAQSTI